MVFAISGQITIKDSEQKFYLQEGDILVLDRNTFIQLKEMKQTYSLI
ncbi:Transcriptional regulator, AraC family / Glycoside hydrolase [Listeria monocytogenes]|nr:Transcriptional regulator, AraC family / Glycoside hydrolase [Listeria monocytogenes]